MKLEKSFAFKGFKEELAIKYGQEKADKMWQFMNIKLLKIVFIVTMAMITLTGCGDDNTGTVSSVAISPTGQYQAEVVQISYGATGGESVIYVEPASENDYPIEHGNNTNNSIRIEETRHGWGTQYEMEWVSDSSFYVISGIDKKDYFLIEMSGNNYQVTEGLVIDNSKTKVLEKTVSGNVMEVTVEISVKNNIGDTVCFSATKYVMTKGFPRGQTTLTATENIETGEPLKIGPNKEKTFTITLVGEKKSDEEFLDEITNTVFVSITKIL